MTDRPCTSAAPLRAVGMSVDVPILVAVCVNLLLSVIVAEREDLCALGRPRHVHGTRETGIV